MIWGPVPRLDDILRAGQVRRRTSRTPPAAIAAPRRDLAGATLLLDGGGLVVGVVNPGESRARRFSRPVELFVGWESSSAFLSIAAAVAALVWANASDSYENLWDAHASLEVGRLHLEESLRHWVNDLLLAVFFFVVALEVKRELLFGSLSDGRSALVPAARLRHHDRGRHGLPGGERGG